MKDTKVDVTDLTASLKELAKEFVSCKSPDNRTVEELQEQCASLITARSKIATRMNSVVDQIFALHPTLPRRLVVRVDNTAFVWNSTESPAIIPYIIDVEKKGVVR